MAGVTVDDPWYVLLSLSVLSAVLCVLVAWFRTLTVVIRVVLSTELGAIGVLLWNTTVPDALVITNTFYLTVSVAGAGIAIFATWSACKGWLGGGLAVGGILVVLVVGRDKISSAFGGGISDAWLSVIFVVCMLVVLVLLWRIDQWKDLWTLTTNIFMGFLLTMATDVITQENPLRMFSDNYGLQLFDVSQVSFIVELVLGQCVVLLLYYRHILCPCCFTLPPSNLLVAPEPKTKTKMKKKKKKLSDLQRFHLMLSSDSEVEPLAESAA